MRQVVGEEDPRKCRVHPPVLKRWADDRAGGGNFEYAVGSICLADYFRAPPRPVPLCLACLGYRDVLFKTTKRYPTRPKNWRR